MGTSHLENMASVLRSLLRAVVRDPNAHPQDLVVRRSAKKGYRFPAPASQPLPALPLEAEAALHGNDFFKRDHRRDMSAHMKTIFVADNVDTPALAPANARLAPAEGAQETAEAEAEAVAPIQGVPTPGARVVFKTRAL